MTSLPLFTLKVGRDLGSTRSSTVVSSSSAAPFFPGGWGWGCRLNFPHFLSEDSAPQHTGGDVSANVGSRPGAERNEWWWHAPKGEG